MNKHYLLFIFVLALFLPCVFYGGTIYGQFKSNPSPQTAAVATTTNTDIFAPIKNIPPTVVQSKITKDLDSEALTYATNKLNAEDPQSLTKEDCAKVVYQQGENLCSYYKVEYLEQKLDKTYKEAGTYLDKIPFDKKPDLQSLKGKWKEMINKTCIVGLMNEGGTLQPLEENGCKIVLLKQHIEFLKWRWLN